MYKLSNIFFAMAVGALAIGISLMYASSVFVSREDQLMDTRDVICGMLFGICIISFTASMGINRFFCRNR